MRRFLFNLASAISLLVFIAASGMWIRSYFASDRITWPHPNYQPPPQQPTIIYGEGHIDCSPNWEPLSELQFAGNRVVRANRVIHSGLGKLEFVLDSPFWREIQPLHLALRLPPARFASPSTTARIESIRSPTSTVVWSFLDFSLEEMSGYIEDGIFPPPGAPKTVFVTRWTIPYWPLAVLTAVLPAIWLRAAITTRWRRMAGRCPICGYDLRATPERCPECGAMARKVDEKETTM